MRMVPCNHCVTSVTCGHIYQEILYPGISYKKIRAMLRRSFYMKLRVKPMPVAILQVIASGAFSVAALAPAMAQQTTTAEPQRVVVTGSLISRADTETATPVQVVTAQDIQRSGKTSIAELLSDLASNGAGTLGTGF